MRLEYPMYPSGMYSLKDGDFDEIAEMIHSEYLPEVLKRPVPVNIDYLIKERFYLEIIKAHITIGGNILGMMVFEDAEIVYYDMLYRPVKETINGSTMIIDLSLSDKQNYARERFTKAHELGHWVCHRSVHSYDKRPYEFRKSPVIACRDESVERYKYREDGRVLELEEWQADRFAASILMPKKSFIAVSERAILNCGIRGGILVKGKHIEESRKAIAAVSSFFMVSKKATQIRMSQLGLLVE